MTNYESLERRRNVIVGVFIAAGLTAFGWLVFKFGDLPVAVTKIRSFDVYVQFTSAPGVEKDTPVRFCGYQIGRVTRVLPPEPLPRITDSGPVGPVTHQVAVVISIEKRYSDIPINSQVNLVTRGLGSSYIEISPPESQPAPDSPARYLSQGARVQGVTGAVSDLLPEQVQHRLEALADSATRLADSANAIIGDPNTQDNVRQTIANLATASGRLVAVLNDLQGTAGQVSDAASEFGHLASEGRQTLTEVRARLNLLTTSLGQTTDQIGLAASEATRFLTELNEGRGTLARLASDPTLYEELLETADQFQILTQQFIWLLEKLEQRGLRGIWRGSPAK